MSTSYENTPLRARAPRRECRKTMRGGRNGEKKTRGGKKFVISYVRRLPITSSHTRTRTVRVSRAINNSRGGAVNQHVFFHSAMAQTWFLSTRSHEAWALRWRSCRPQSSHGTASVPERSSLSPSLACQQLCCF